MNCQDAQQFVSALYDGEAVPADAAEHIRGCRACRERLHDYAEIGAELRLLADDTPQEGPSTLHLPPERKRWGRKLTDRVLVPRFAAALAILAIVVLAAGLVVMRAQSKVRPLWFQYNLSVPKAERATSGFYGQGGLVQGGGRSRFAVLWTRNGGRIIVKIRPLDVRKDLVQLSVWARAVKPAPGEDKTLSRQELVRPQLLNHVLSGTVPRQIGYTPGQELTIPVEGGGSFILTGKVYKIRPTIWGPAVPKPNELQLQNGALLRDNDFLGEIQGGGGGEAKNSALGIFVPKVGALVVALKPFEGATRGVAEYGQARFAIGGQHYTLYSAVPITGGPQPREIWVYHSQKCAWAAASTPRTPIMFAFGDVSMVLKEMRK